jgi:hypothetical protein
MNVANSFTRVCPLKARISHLTIHLLTFLTFCLQPILAADSNPLDVRPPRTFVTPQNLASFRAFCLEGGGRTLFNALRNEFATNGLSATFPPEPEDFGDPDPLKRTSEKVDRWREAQAVCNFVAGVAEAGVLFWKVTGETQYLAKARAFLLAASRWDPVGTTGIQYNDEAHFRLWRKLPFVYDQLREQLTDHERAAVLESFRRRGASSFTLISTEIAGVKRNSIENEVASHGVRFVSMTGLAGLALYDDMPEARPWLACALRFYRDQFTPWGGEDGGWGEGTAYWRGNIEHGRFQDALLTLRHPDAWQNPFWKRTGYFPLYFVQPYPTTQFGDTPSAGKLQLEPQMANFLVRLARQFQDGYLRSYAELADDAAVLRQGLNYTRPNYPTGIEYLLRNFAGSQQPLPAAKPLADLPQSRWFRDIGWVSFHSTLGAPADDIMLSFKSSPYASYSHSHADQNAFILNAFGESLAINAGYREFHRSPHHAGYTRQTVSKNAILIHGAGQLAQSERARGRITRLETTRRVAIATGDATDAYNAGASGAPVVRAIRDIAFIDHRYFVIRDVITLKKEQPVSWLLHADNAITWDQPAQRATIQRRNVRLLVELAAWQNNLQASLTDEFPVPVDTKYEPQGYANQSHLNATTAQSSKSHLIYAVLWPAREENGNPLNLELKSKRTLLISRPDGKQDRISFTDDDIRID